MNDGLHFAMSRACRKFGGADDGIFNLAGLSAAIVEISGLKACIDGEILRALLVGRDDVEEMSGGSHYRLKALGD